MNKPAILNEVVSKIITVRGCRVLLSTDLSALYGVKTKALVQAVKRNIDRFPDDFMFQLTEAEWANLRSQFVTASWGGIRLAPYAFTQEGVAMLSSVLRSTQAIETNVAIMRAFVQQREVIASHQILARKINQLEKKYDHNFKLVFDAIRELMTPPPPPPKKHIGFKGEE
jgi:hypothetical protein